MNKKLITLMLWYMVVITAIILLLGGPLKLFNFCWLCVWLPWVGPVCLRHSLLRVLIGQMHSTHSLKRCARNRRGWDRTNCALACERTGGGGNGDTGEVKSSENKWQASAFTWNFRGEEASGKQTKIEPSENEQKIAQHLLGGEKIIMFELCCIVELICLPSCSE